MQITIETIKKSLLDFNFRNLFPEYKAEIDKWITNPNCKCNLPLYKVLLANGDKLAHYFKDSNIQIDEAELLQTEEQQLNQWIVINCKIDELEQKMNELPHGPKQIAIARYEDDVTVLINDPIFN